jgi:RNA polymerase-binding transcription factor DksA
MSVRKKRESLGAAKAHQRARPASATAARRRIEQERQAAIDRLRQFGVAIETDEETPGAGPDTVLDEGDEAQISERTDMAFMTRERLAERINRLTAALERVGQGQYGCCADCGGTIERARLAALPETETCLACQQRREARGTNTAA